MVCNPSDNTINVFSPPLPPGQFGIPTAPIQIPFPGVDLPTGLIQDLQELVNGLGLVFPSSTFKPNIDNFTKTVFDLVGNLLTQIAPFLSFYNFITAMMNLIVCIIEVLCALMNPFKVASAVKRLFRQCLPAFIAMFPWMALIAIIVAFLLLMVALIDYLITAISSIIDEIIRNIEILTSAIAFQDATVTLAAIQKLAELICLIQNTLAILLAVAAIIAIIQSLSSVGGTTICDDDNSCCGIDVCPPFIRDAPIEGTTAQLVYSNQVNIDYNGIFGNISGLPSGFSPAVLDTSPARIERWQLVETQNTTYKFSDIITPSTDPNSGNTTEKFWPEGISFSARTPKNKACYLCDLRFQVNPNNFGITDQQGTRFFQVKDCIVVREPYKGIVTYDNDLDSSSTTGTLNLEGGLVYEDDGETPFIVNGSQATLNNFIHLPKQTTYSELPNNLVTLDNISYTLKIGYETLMSYQLITVGCLPEVRVEKAVFNSVITSEDVRAVLLKLSPVPDGEKVASGGILPNVEGAQNCLMNSLEEFRKNVTLESAAQLKANMEVCLNDLKDQTLAALCGALSVGASQFKSEVSLSTDIEFITRTIEVRVVLKDPVGTNISLNIPEECAGKLAEKLRGEVTLGELSGFSYDGEGFVATLSSSLAGNGVLSISFDNKVFSSVVAGNEEIPSRIEEHEIQYSFIDSTVEPIIRRDESDKG